MHISTIDTAAETLHDGRRVLIRPIRKDDSGRNAQFVHSLSSSSRRYLSPRGASRLSDQQLCDPDYWHDMAFIALDVSDTTQGTEKQVALARYSTTQNDTGAEIAIAVADDWQHEGLGTLMLRYLIRYARSHGVERVYSIDATQNEKMRRLARHVGFTEQPDPQDCSRVIYSLKLQRA